MKHICKAIVVLLAGATLLDTERAVAAPANPVSPSPAPAPASIAVPAVAQPVGGVRLQRRAQTVSWRKLRAARPQCQPAPGQYSCVKPCDRCWNFMLALPLWIPGISAQAGEGDVSVDGERDPTDAIDGDAAGDVEFAFVGAFLARRGRWGGGVDFLTARIKASAAFSIADGLVEVGADGKLSAAIARARIDYLYSRAMVPWKLSDCGCAEHRVYAGARVFDVALKANANNVAGLALDVSDTWVDPIIGFESRIPFARNWALQIAGDVGGFDIADSWSYSLLGGLHWRFAKRWGSPSPIRCSTSVAHSITTPRRSMSICAGRS